MEQKPVLDVLVIILGIFGFAGIFSGIVVKLIGRKIDKSDKAAAARQAAMIQCMVLNQEGAKLNTEAIYALAGIATTAHGETHDLTIALDNLDDYEKRDAENTRKNAAAFVYGPATTSK